MLLLSGDHDGVLIVLFALARAFFREADGLDDFESVHVIPGKDGLQPSQTRSG